MPHTSPLSFLASIAAAIIAINAPRLRAAPTTQADSQSLQQPLSLDEDQDDRPTTTTTSPQSTRYFLGLLDSRSSYGHDFFHDPLIGPEFDAEQQIELDYAHAEAAGFRENDIDAGFQWNPIGQLTFAGEFGWDSEHQFTPDGGDGDDPENENSSGFENVDLAVYHPIFQFVTSDNLLDYSAVVRFDISIPTRTPVSSTDVQLTPFIGHLLRIGQHLSLEAWTGPQFIIAPNQINTLIYGGSFGYIIPHNDFPIPFTDQLTPIFELDGQAPFSPSGAESLFGVAGFQLSFKSIDEAQPQIEIGYQFPLDSGARSQLHWGILAQVFLGF
jgi:hypothetical protein